MKKKILPILIMSLFCTSCGQSINYSIEEYRTTLEFHDDFKILQLTDLHLGIESDLAKQLGFLCKSIDEANPDLIILTGDNFMYGSKGIVKNLFKTLNENDYCAFNREYIIKCMNKRNLLTESIKKELKYDSDYEIRKYANGYIK